MRITSLILFGLLTAGCAQLPKSGPASSFEALFEPMGEPQPGDWLYVRDEPGQSFEAYTLSSPNRKGGGRDRIYVVPMGGVAESEPGLMPMLEAFVGAFFDTPVTLAEAQPVPREALNAKRKQHDAHVILEHLAESLPADAAACIGFLEYDLYFAGLNFVFGLGAFNDRRTGVYSLARYRFEYINQAKDVTLAKRALKVAVHELSHIFGLPHCRRWRCVMNGSNSIAESDARPLFLCPECLKKLQWNLGFDPLKRYERLASFYSRHAEFEAEAKRARALAASLRGKSGTTR